MSALNITTNGCVARVTLNRPDVRNAFNEGLIAALTAAFAELGAREDLRAVVLAAEGKAFCAGADLKSPPGSVVGGRRGFGLDQLMAQVQDCAKPVIAAVNGAAFAGGIGLVGACDIVIAAEDALFSFSEVRLGVVPAMISVVWLPKLGPHRAMRRTANGMCIRRAVAWACSCAPCARKTGSARSSSPRGRARCTT